VVGEQVLDSIAVGAHGCNFRRTIIDRSVIFLELQGGFLVPRENKIKVSTFNRF
jgi:hypothetical protein